MNFKLHFGELHSDNSINDKNNMFENYIPKCDKVKRILISFNCFSEYINRRAQNIANTRQNKNIKDPQKKYRLGTVSKIFYWRA